MVNTVCLVFALYVYQEMTWYHLHSQIEEHPSVLFVILRQSPSGVSTLYHSLIFTLLCAGPLNMNKHLTAEPCLHSNGNQVQERLIKMKRGKRRKEYNE